MKSSEETIKQFILVFAHAFIDENGYHEYPEIWRVKPLANLLPYFYTLFGLYSPSLRDAIKDAVEHKNIITIKSQHPRLFKQDEAYYITRTKLSNAKSPYWYDKPAEGSLAAEVTNLLFEISEAINDCFASLRATDEGEHRTLEHIARALGPLVHYLFNYEEWTLVQDMLEYSDQWRGLSDSERLRLYRQLRASSGARIATEEILEKDVDKTVELFLVVFARDFRNEVVSDKFSKAWTTPPLIEVIPLITKLLNVHPSHLGDILATAINRGMLNNLDQIYPQYFDMTTHDYEMQVLLAESPFLEARPYPTTLASSVETILEKELMPKILAAFVKLHRTDEHENHTLVNVVKALDPLGSYLRPAGDSLTFAMNEHVRSWRTIPDDTRNALAEKITAEVAATS